MAILNESLAREHKKYAGIGASLAAKIKKNLLDLENN